MITSTRHPRVQAVRRLHRRSARVAERRFVVEGPQAVREALDVLEELFATDPGDPLAGFHTLFLLCAGFAAVSACLIAVPSRQESI